MRTGCLSKASTPGCSSPLPLCFRPWIIALRELPILKSCKTSSPTIQGSEQKHACGRPAFAWHLGVEPGLWQQLISVAMIAVKRLRTSNAVTCIECRIEHWDDMERFLQQAGADDFPSKQQKQHATLDACLHAAHVFALPSLRRSSEACAVYQRITWPD